MKAKIIYKRTTKNSTKKAIRKFNRKTLRQLSFADYLSRPDNDINGDKSLTQPVRFSNAKVNTGSNHQVRLSKVNSKLKSADLSAMRARRIHGGEIGKGRRKLRRPIVSGKWMHVTLKSTLAKGAYSLLNIKHRLKVQGLIHAEAKRNFITIGDGVNMGNHFHLKIKCQNRQGFQKFLRAITGKIARLVTGAQKGKPFGKRFWDSLAFSRVLTSTYEVFRLKVYFQANRKERTNGYQARQIFLEQFNLWLRRQYREGFGVYT